MDSNSAFERDPDQLTALHGTCTETTCKATVTVATEEGEQQDQTQYSDITPPIQEADVDTTPELLAPDVHGKRKKDCKATERKKTYLISTTIRLGSPTTQKTQRS